MPVAEFWQQTPRLFVAIMEGRARAAEHRFEMMISQAWHTGAFAGAASGGKLKPLKRYLSASKAKAQGPQEMMATLRELQARGAPMNIRRRGTG